jgi:hypothetical protein
MNVHGTDDDFVGTRTAAFEAEEAERKASEAKRRPRAPSPPPYKPVRKPNQSNPSYYLGKPYLGGKSGKKRGRSGIPSTPAASKLMQ